MNVALVNLSGQPLELIRLCELGNSLQDRWCFHTGSVCELNIAITANEREALYDCSGVVPDTTIRDINGLCRYSRLHFLEYLYVCVALATTCKSALLKSDYLRFEDFLYDCSPTCLLNPTLTRSGYSQPLDYLSVCKKCQEFYRCVGCEKEIDNLLASLHRLSKLREKRSVERWASHGQKRPPLY